MWKKIKPYVFFVVITLGTGLLSAYLSGDNMNIYEDINTPPLSPPSQIFPIVWTVLYVLMGIGAALVYICRRKNVENAKRGLVVFAVQLAVNFLWSIIFFNYRAFLLAFLWLILLWVLIITVIKLFKSVSPNAAYLQIPYFIWVTFAGYLTFAIYLLN